MGLLQQQIFNTKFVIIPYFLEFFPKVRLTSECANMRVQFEGGNKTRAGKLISQHFRTRMCTALLADLAQMNVKSALDCDKST